MTLSLKHTFVSPVPDDANPDTVSPSNWNAEHTFLLGADRIVGRLSDSGAAQELTPADLLGLIDTVDGTGSGLDADLLDGNHGAAYALLATLASTANGAGASLIGLEDAGALFTAVDVEAALSELRVLVDGLSAATVLVGDWDPTSGVFPGGGTAQQGFTYVVTTAGTVDGVTFAQNDRIVAIVDNASTTVFSANWLKLAYTDQVVSVDGMTGAVDLSGSYQPLGTTSLGWVTPQEHGAVGDGVTDDTAAFAAWLAALGGQTGYIPKGHYILNSALTNTADDIDVICHPEAIFDFTGAPSTGGFIFGGGDEMTNLAVTLAVTHAVGERTIEVSGDPAVATGDICVIWNDDIGSFNPTRDYYKKGELFRVLRKDTLGDNLVKNWHFDSSLAAYPVRGTGWTLSGSEATHASGSGETRLSWPADGMIQGFTAGASYRVRYEPTGATGGVTRPILSGGTEVPGPAAVPTNTPTDQTIIAGAGNTGFDIAASDTWNGSIPIVRVQKVGNFIFQEDGLTFGYNPAENLSLYKLTMRKVRWRGGHIIGNNHTWFIGMQLTQVEDPLIENLSGEHCGNTCVRMFRCFRGRTVNFDYFTPGHAASDWSEIGTGSGGQNHGWTCLATYEHAVVNPNIRSGFQGLTFTGGDIIASVPNIRCRVLGGYFSGPQTMDMHGGCKDCGIDGATLNGSMNVGGEGPWVKNCDIGPGANGTPWPYQAIHYREVIGNTLRIEDVNILLRGAMPDPNEGLISCPGMQPEGNGLIVIRNITVDGGISGRDLENIVRLRWAAGLNGGVRCHLENIIHRGGSTPLATVIVDSGGVSPLTLVASNLAHVTLSTSGDIRLTYESTKLGWGVPTGTATRTAFATDTVTLPELGRRVKALIDDLTVYGIIGP